MAEFLTMLAVFISVIFRRFRRWLTLRRVLGIAAILILLLMVQGLVFGMGMGADLPILFGLDWGLAIETSVLLMALSVRDRVLTVVSVVKSWISLKRKGLNRILQRYARRAPRSRPTSTLLPPPPEDEPTGWIFSVA